MKSLKSIFLGAVISLSSICAMGAENVVFPKAKPIPCGTISEMKLSTESDISLEWDEQKFKEKPSLSGGQKFAEIFVQVPAGRSIGKYDFSLAGAPCLAMSDGTDAYSPLNREYIAEGAKMTVKLLFVVKEEENPFSLTYNFVDKISTFDPALTAVQLDVKEGALVVPTPSAPAAKAPQKAAAKKKDAPKKKKKGGMEEAW